MLPDALQQVINALESLPGVGSRTAERYAYYLFRANPKISDSIIKSLGNLHSKVKSCPITFALIDGDDDVSELYSNPERDKKSVLVVEEPLDIYAIEQTKAYKGTYHVLGGAISPIDGISPDQLHIKELVDRVKTDDVKEVIIATNSSLEGETTAMYISKLIKPSGIKVSRIASGVPVGGDLEYIDEVTLLRALEGRVEL